jgi:hypothetical protein
VTNEKLTQNISQDPFSWRDTNSLRFVAQFFFSTLILGFCLIQLTRTDIDNKNPALYWSCLSGILALWMPSPAAAGTSSSRASSNEPESGPNANSSLVFPPREVLDESRLQK